jgi:amidophosphoribosyltransferase
MSDKIKHECGLGFIRLLKPLDHYVEKYGTSLYGLYKLQLLMQKMRNRGQDGAGIATIKLDVQPGHRYISRKRSNSSQYLKDLFDDINGYFNDLTEEQKNDPQWMKDNLPYTGELLMGHLRYGTHGSNSIESVHPFLRLNNWKNRNIAVAGNFNLTNVDELFNELVELGQYPKEKSDTVTVMEKIGHFLDEEVQRLFSWFKPEGYSNQELNDLICDNMDIQRVLQRASRKWDGGYIMGGMIGHGDAFIIRDPHGIRPGYYYKDDEKVIFASEKPAIQTSFDILHGEVKELKPGHALIIKKNGTVEEKLINTQKERKSCSFERIYFSRGNDRDIYTERKKLGELLAPRVLDAVDHDLENTIFSFIPNTAETAFFGMVEGLQKEYAKVQKERILEKGSSITQEELDNILQLKPRVEKVVVKDAKMRTFIADDKSRGQLVSSVYDVTYGMVRNGKDRLVLMDDSIVRGTTLKESILTNLYRLKPRQIVIVSSAPQIRYPDCYGIDMSKMGNFAAFRSLVSLLKSDGQEDLLEQCYHKCLTDADIKNGQIVNHVKALYDVYTQEKLSERMAEMLKPDHVDCEVKIIFQSIDNLHLATPDHIGDWYFSGDYPTPGGQRIVNKAFINFMEKKDVRAYS